MKGRGRGKKGIGGESEGVRVRDEVGGGEVGVRAGSGGVVGSQGRVGVRGSSEARVKGGGK